jgi:outer membrane protein assembly factor BamA
MAHRMNGGLWPPILRAVGRTLWSAPVACLLAALACGPALAQAPDQGYGTAKVAAVTFSGSQRFHGDELARDIGLAPGTVVSKPDIQAAADRLSRLGWFSDVQYRFETSMKGVNIQFTVHDAPTHPVWFDNFPWFSDAELAAAIRVAGWPYDGTAPEEGTALDGYREAIAALLKTKNIAGQVEGELVQAPESESLVERFRVTGDQVWVSSLEFSDAVARDDPRLKDLLSTIVGKPYSRYNLAIFLTEQVRPAYTSRGYLRVRFGEPVAEFIGDPTKPLSDHIDVRVPVVPGIQYHWGGAAWSGDVALDQSALNGLLGLSAGEPADGLKIQAGWDRIAKEYAKRGYLQAKVNPAPQFNDAESRVSYAVQIAEGIQYRMGRLVLTGLSLTAERLLLANWKIARGDVFDDAYFEDFLNGGAKKIFRNSPVRFERIGHLLQPNTKTKTVDVFLDFR